MKGENDELQELRRGVHEDLAAIKAAERADSERWRRQRAALVRSGELEQALAQLRGRLRSDLVPGTVISATARPAAGGSVEIVAFAIVHDSRVNVAKSLARLRGWPESELGCTCRAGTTAAAFVAELGKELYADPDAFGLVGFSSGSAPL